MVAQYTLYKHDKPAQCTPYQHHFLHLNLMFELCVSTLHYISNILFLVPVCNKQVDVFSREIISGAWLEGRWYRQCCSENQIGGGQPDLDQRTEPKSNPNLVQIKYHTAKGAFEVLSLKMHQMWNGGYGAGLSHCMWG